MAEEELTAAVGRHVEIELKTEDGDVETLSLDIVPDEAADFARGFLGESTPLAQAILGHAAGSVVPYRVGDIVEVRIRAISAELSASPEDLTKRRQETVRKAIHDSDRTNMIIFASSMNSKWGDYDPSGIKDDEEDASTSGDTGAEPRR